jgi:hypothetical protein
MARLLGTYRFSEHIYAVGGERPDLEQSIGKEEDGECDQVLFICDVQTCLQIVQLWRDENR